MDQEILQILEHMFLEYFDNIDKLDDKENKKCFEQYFKKKKEKEKEKDYEKNIIFELSYDIFTDCYDELNKTRGDGEKDESNLVKLYSTAFIKIYLTKFVEAYNKYEPEEIKSIWNLLVGKTNITKVIKIYILKLLYNLTNKNWEKLSNEKLFKIIIQDNNNFNQQQFNSKYLLNFFIPDISFENENKKFIETIYGNEKEEKTSKILEENIDLFLSLAINKIISNLFLQSYLDLGEGSEYYNHLCKYFEKNFKKINKNLKALLNLFFKKNDFEKILKQKYVEQTKDKNIKGEPYESLLYGLRFCAQSLLKINKDKKNDKQKYLFSSILSDECFKMIKENFIPGNNVQKNKKLESFKLLKKCINDSPNDIGFYICDCGCFYSLALSDISYDNFESKCRNCTLPIGSEKNISKDKNNNNSCYYRIFKSEAQMKEQLLKEIKSYENIKN